MPVKKLIVILCLIACVPACSKSEPTPAAQPINVQKTAGADREPLTVSEPISKTAQEVVNPDVTPKEQTARTAAGLFNELQARFAKVEDYQCVFDAFVAQDDKTDRRVYNYYFKRFANDKRIRMEVIRGKNSGAKLVYNGQDVVVRPSGIIIDLFTFAFTPTDKKLCDLRGFTIPQSDWGTFIDGHIKYLGQCSSKIIARDTSNGQEIIIIEIESGRPEETMDIAREKVWLDDKEKVLLKFEQYDKSGKLIRANSYLDIKINSGLKDELFSNP